MKYTICTFRLIQSEVSANYSYQLQPDDWITATMRFFAWDGARSHGFRVKYNQSKAGVCEEQHAQHHLIVKPNISNHTTIFDCLQTDRSRKCQEFVFGRTLSFKRTSCGFYHQIPLPCERNNNIALHWGKLCPYSTHYARNFWHHERRCIQNRIYKYLISNFSGFLGLQWWYDRRAFQDVKPRIETFA